MVETHIIRENYNKMPEEQQCSLYTCIGNLACASASEVSSRDDGLSLQFKCYDCDAESRDSSRSASRVGPELEEAFSALAKLINMPRTQKHRRPRVAAMLALKRLLSHTSNVDNLDLATSPFGQWCLQALHSSIRELRVAAGSVNIFSFFSHCSLSSVGALYPSFCKILQTPKLVSGTVKSPLMFCVSFLNKAIWPCRKLAYWPGDRLLGIFGLLVPL